VPDHLKIDSLRLRQVLVNLASNAIKFTSQGEIFLEVVPDPATPSQEDRIAAAHGSGTLEKCHLRFSVRDTGLGIPQDKHALIFEAFTQADGSTTRKYGGTGLGLTISSRLVAMMGGKIWVESEVGRGSIFYFTAAFERTPEAESVEPAYLRDLRRFSGIPVLLVEPNPINRASLAELLESWGLNPAIAGKEEEGLRLLEQSLKRGNGFQVVMIEAGGPGLDGFDLTAKMLALGQPAGSIILRLTSASQVGQQARVRQLGLSHTLVRPAKYSEIAAILLTVLQEGKSADPLTAAGEKAPEPPLPARQIRILLAEDNTVNQRLAIRLLEKQGFLVTAVYNGRELLEVLETRQFDLILMDVQMPEIDGLEATRQVRQKEKESGRYIPIVAMTAHAMKGDMERCLEAGMDGYVSKPIQKQLLLSEIERVVGCFSPTHH
jgi:CheY-like chemotaxis protein